MKCDRCGKEMHKSDLRCFIDFHWKSLDGRSGMIYEICPVCMNQFKQWLKNGQISGQLRFF